MTTATDPYNTKNMRVSWNHFDRLLTCFRKDTRRFFISDKDAGVDNHIMSMDDIISFWDGGIEGTDIRKILLEILECAASLEIYDTKVAYTWTIKRTA